eukprot:TRINITY_DN722_c0_g1_i1.p1 TRINITY_DN722_c0_g1~~TRINITY_DN722_c0_g1_i1.p1  ORF type:complete len:142 (+),score=62.94 TRINITY_DN722_c0_g1_i1:49-474(+)
MSRGIFTVLLLVCLVSLAFGLKMTTSQKKQKNQIPQEYVEDMERMQRYLEVLENEKEELANQNIAIEEGNKQMDAVERIDHSKLYKEAKKEQRREDRSVLKEGSDNKRKERDEERNRRKIQRDIQRSESVRKNRMMSSKRM